jgi:putative Holliday junction resolvase
MMQRVLAVDPGDKRIGLAISDPSQRIANPLVVIKHVSRAADAARIAEIASENNVGLIVIGSPLDSEGNAGPQARKSERLADIIRLQTEISVILWDESGSSQEAEKAQQLLRVKRKRRREQLDALAATVILQDFLDHHGNETQ